MFFFWYLDITGEVQHEGKFHQRYDNKVDGISELTDTERWKLEAPLRYQHLPEGERRRVDEVLRGNVPLNDLPTLPHRAVKIFISSTFTGKDLVY